MFKKMMAVLLASMMALSVNVSVGAEEAAEAIVLTAWTDANCGELLVRAAEKYSEATGVAVKVEYDTGIYGSIPDTLTTMAESGDLSEVPDIIMMVDAEFERFVTAYPELYYDVSEYEGWDQNVEWKIAQTTVDGKHYGFPIDCASTIMIYRTDLLAEAGYTIDDVRDVTWDKWLEVAKDVKEKTGKYIGSFRSGVAGSGLFDNMRRTATDIFDEEGNPTIAGNEVLYELAEIAKEVYDAGVLYEPSSDWSDYATSPGSANISCAYVDGCWVANEAKANYEDGSVFAIGGIPKYNEETPMHGFEGGSSYFVTGVSEYKEVATEMMAYMFLGEGFELIHDSFVEFGLLPANIAILESGYYDTVDDGFFPVGFYGDIANAVLNTKVANKSPLASIAAEELKAAVQDYVLNGADLKTSIDAGQDSIEFQLSE